MFCIHLVAVRIRTSPLGCAAGPNNCLWQISERRQVWFMPPRLGRGFTQRKVAGSNPAALTHKTLILLDFVAIT